MDSTGLSASSQPVNQSPSAPLHPPIGTHSQPLGNRMLSEALEKRVDFKGAPASMQQICGLVAWVGKI